MVHLKLAITNILKRKVLLEYNLVVNYRFYIDWKDKVTIQKKEFWSVIVNEVIILEEGTTFF